MANPIYYILSDLAALVALTVHEYSHAYAAYKLGDDTAKNFATKYLADGFELNPNGEVVTK